MGTLKSTNVVLVARLDQFLAWPETLPPNSQLQRLGVPSRLQVVQEISRLISNDLMESRVFFKLADHLGIDLLRNFLREAKWSGHSSAETAFKENLSSWVLKYAIVKGHTRTVEQLGPYTHLDLTYAVWNRQSELIPVLLRGCTEYEISQLWNVLRGHYYWIDPPYDDIPWEYPLNLLEMERFLGYVDQLFPGLAIDPNPSEHEQGPSDFVDFLHQLHLDLAQDGSWDPSTIARVLELLSKLGADIHEEIYDYCDGKTVLHEAVMAENYELVSLFLQHGAVPDQAMVPHIDRPEGSSANGCVFQHIAKGQNHEIVVKIAKILIE